MQQLNKEQQAAVDSDEKRILCVAGAGTGKTRVLTHRIERMVQGRGESPLSILALTFTRKAAGEMAERLGGMLTPAEVHKLRIGTFHSVALQIVREWGERLGYRPNLSIYDQVDQKDVIESIISDFGIRAKVKDVLEVMQHKAEFQSLPHPKEPDVKPALDAYHNTLRRYNALDYQGLLDTAVKLLRLYPDVLKHYRQQWRLVFVDEYQDTDIVQWEFLELLNPDQLFVVGDSRQSIYGWRGARPDLLMEFAKLATRFDLVKNYRSLPGIVDHANGVIPSKLYGEPLVATRKSDNGRQVLPGAFDDLLREGAFIVDEILSLTETQGYGFGDIAVLARKNRQLSNFAQWLKDSGEDRHVPYVRIGAKMDFWKSEPARVCAQVLKLINNPNDNQSLRSILKILNIEVPELKRLEWVSSKSNRPLVMLLPEDNPVRRGFELINREGVEDSPAELVFMSFIGECDIREHYLERKLTTKADQVERFAAALEYRLLPLTLKDFLDWYNFKDLTDELTGAEAEGKVRLMTVHSAKGLEFPVVIVMGCADGDFPSKRGDPAEERRLFYVAATRGKDRLYITCPLTDEWGKPQKPSSFLKPLAVEV